MAVKFPRRTSSSSPRGGADHLVRVEVRRTLFAIQCGHRGSVQITSENRDCSLCRKPHSYGRSATSRIDAADEFAVRP